MFGTWQLFCFYLIMFSTTSLKVHCISVRTPWTLAYIFPLPCLLPVFLHLLFLFIFCLSFKTDFKCYAFHEVPHCLNHSFFLLIPITHLYFFYEYHTMPCIICILFLLSYKLLENMDFLCKVFSFFLY